MNIKEYDNFSKQLNNHAERFSQQALSGEDTDHLNQKITPFSVLYQNSITLSLGAPGTGKTTHFMREMFMISESVPVIKQMNKNFECPVESIFYVTDKPYDRTFNRMYPHINIPFKKISYEDLFDSFEEYVNYKSTVPEIANKQTILFCDDAGEKFNCKNKKMIALMTQLRHYKCIFFICIQSWKMISPKVKSLISVVYLAPGMSELDFRYLKSQLTNMSLTSDEIKNIYFKLPSKFHKLMIDTREGTMKII